MKLVKLKRKPCPAVRRKARAMMAALVALMAALHTAASLAGGVQDYNQYVNDSRCSRGQDNCLEEVSHVAERSDGRRVRITGIFRWRRASNQKFTKCYPISRWNTCASCAMPFTRTGLLAPASTIRSTI